MNIDYPTQDQAGELRALWQEAFGDDGAFLEHFFTYGFASDRCRCITMDGKVVAALYWFDCAFDGKPLAYLYGIATSKAYRGQGICPALVENTHSHLKLLGYAGEILVPAGESLFLMYEKMGYSTCAWVTEMTCEAGLNPVDMRPINKEEYRLLRRQFLPENAVVQEGSNLDFLEAIADFYAGKDFLITISRGEELFAPELLGNAQSAPGILAAMHKKRGKFRTPGNNIPFAMYYPLSDSPEPGYFGLAFD